MATEKTALPEFHSGIKSSSLTWLPLQQINFYRLLLSIGFLAAYYNSEWMSFLGSYDPKAYLTTSFLMIGSSLVYIFLGQTFKPGFKSQVILSNTSDILFITLLSHFSGGLTSSLSILLIINITATGAFLRNREAILFAALASLAVLSEQTYSMIQGINPVTFYSQAGLLGLTFFGTSFLASIVSKRAHQSEQLAIEREADIINLETLNEDIIQNMRTGIIVVNDESNILMANSSAETLLGNTPLSESHSLGKILPELERTFLEWQEHPNLHPKAIRQEQGLPDIQPGFRRLIRTRNTLIFLEDATQLNQRFQQIKLASLGRLTASIAHEIRNPLSAINHAAQLLMEADLIEADKKLCTIITTQVQRLDKTVQNVLQLSRQQKGEPEAIELNQWLSHFCTEFINSIDLTTDHLQLDLHKDSVIVLFEPSHLSQVMYNLCNNAITHHENPETIKIQVVCSHDEEFDQPYIDVIDNGPGITDENIEQIFDPFFTTNSKGTGLGLYISKEIIESNRAKIRYIRTQEGGSCFRIHFLSSIK